MEREKRYDLADRTFRFASNARTFIKKLRKTIANVEDMKQFIRASGSVGANYIEARCVAGKSIFALNTYSKTGG